MVDQPWITFEGIGVIIIKGVSQYQRRHKDQQKVLRWLVEEIGTDTVAKHRGQEKEENGGIYEERAEDKEENQDEDHKENQDNNKENIHNPREVQEADWEEEKDWWQPIWEVENIRKVRQSSLDDLLKRQLVITEIFLEHIERLPASAEHSYTTLLQVQDQPTKSFWVAGKHERGETE